MTDKQLARRVAAAHERLVATIRRCTTLLKDAEDGLAVEVAKAKEAGLLVSGSLTASSLYDDRDSHFISRYMEERTSSAGCRVSRTIDLVDQAPTVAP